MTLFPQVLAGARWAKRVTRPAVVRGALIGAAVAGGYDALQHAKINAERRDAIDQFLYTRQQWGKLFDEVKNSGRLNWFERQKFERLPSFPTLPERPNEWPLLMLAGAALGAGAVSAWKIPRRHALSLIRRARHGDLNNAALTRLLFHDPSGNIRALALRRLSRKPNAEMLKRLTLDLLPEQSRDLTEQSKTLWAQLFTPESRVGQTPIGRALRLVVAEHKRQKAHTHPNASETLSRALVLAARNPQSVRTAGGARLLFEQLRNAQRRQQIKS